MAAASATPAVDIDVINADDISWGEAYDKYLATNKPVLFRGACREWKALRQWVHPDGSVNVAELRSEFGSCTCPVVTCSLDEYGAQKCDEMSLDAYFDVWKAESTIAAPLYLKDWHCVRQCPHAAELYKVPLLMCDDWLNWYDIGQRPRWCDKRGGRRYWDHCRHGENDYRFVYLGCKGSWTPLHHDVLRSHSWSANVCGRKKWVFIPPEEEHKLQDKLGNIATRVHDIEAPNPKYPLGHTARRTVIEQEPGDVMFVPSGWYHEVINLEDTISINHNWFAAVNLRDINAFLMSELAAVRRAIEDCKEGDDALYEWEEQCQLVMRANAGMNMREWTTLLHAKARRILDLLPTATKTPSQWHDPVSSGCSPMDAVDIALPEHVLRYSVNQIAACLQLLCNDRFVQGVLIAVSNLDELRTWWL